MEKSQPDIPSKNPRPSEASLQQSLFAHSSGTDDSPLFRFTMLATGTIRAPVGGSRLLITCKRVPHWSDHQDGAEQSRTYTRFSGWICHGQPHVGSPSIVDADTFVEDIQKIFEDHRDYIRSLALVADRETKGPTTLNPRYNPALFAAKKFAAGLRNLYETSPISQVSIPSTTSGHMAAESSKAKRIMTKRCFNGANPDFIYLPIAAAGTTRNKDEQNPIHDPLTKSQVTVLMRSLEEIAKIRLDPGGEGDVVWENPDVECVSLLGQKVVSPAPHKRLKPSELEGSAQINLQQGQLGQNYRDHTTYPTSHPRFAQISASDTAYMYQRGQNSQCSIPTVAANQCFQNQPVPSAYGQQSVWSEVGASQSFYGGAFDPAAGQYYNTELSHFAPECFVQWGSHPDCTQEYQADPLAPRPADTFDFRSAQQLVDTITGGNDGVQVEARDSEMPRYLSR